MGMDSVTANYFALFEVINHSFGEPGIPWDLGGKKKAGKKKKKEWRNPQVHRGGVVEFVGQGRLPPPQAAPAWIWMIPGVGNPWNNLG